MKLVLNSQRDYLKVLAEIDPREFSPEADSFEKEFEESRKWYNYEDDMKKLSQIPISCFMV